MINWRDIDYKEQAEQFRFAVSSFPDAAQFIVKEKVWEGFWKYGWFSRILTLAAILIGLNMINNVFEFFSTLRNGLSEMSISGIGTFAQTAFESSYAFLTGSGSRFFMLALLEVIIFHASRRTLHIIAGKESNASFNDFVHAQVRMLVVSGYAWGMTLGLAIPVKIFFGIFEGAAFLKMPVLFLIEAYFMGFSIVDNYQEQYGLSIKQSAKYAQRYLAINLAIGIVVRVLFWVPIAGPVFAPLLAAVAATMVMHQETPLKTEAEAMATTQPG